MADTLDVTFTNLSQLSRAYGSPATDMATAIIQQSAYGQLISGLAALGLAVFMGFVCYKCSRVAFAEDSYRMPVGLVLPTFFGAILGGVAAVAGVVISTLCLSDIWMWTAMSNPRLALAHQIFGSMGGQ